MITYNTKNTLIFKENNDVFNEEYFDLSRQKYIHNIDTLYYTVYIDVEDYNNDVNVKSFINYLNVKRDEIQSTFESSCYHEVNSKLISQGYSFSKLYKYSIESPDEYVIFVAEKKATDKTPELIVQLRSEFLWINGEHAAIEKSYLDLVDFLEYFNLDVGRIVENRIDFAYHTNYIQDHLNFFKEENLNKMQVSRFSRWNKEGRFVGSDITESDYLSFGRRKSNNTFVRIYNKTQEVVNQNYKQFFIKIWLLNKLINRFDYYVLEKCFENGSYGYLDKARLEFYLENGQDSSIKKNINCLLDRGSSEEISNLANKLVPSVTLVTNIEFQTKRKFYSTMDNSISLLNTVTCKYSVLERLYKIFDNKDIFHEYLTSDVLRFIDYDSHTRKENCNVSNWWKRLQQVKLNNVITDENRKLIREYQNNLDVQIMKRNTLYSLTTLSLYMNKDNNNSVHSDTIDFLSYLNESDIQKSIKYKKKKSALLRNQFDNLESLEIDNFYQIINSETAEILD